MRADPRFSRQRKASPRPRVPHSWLASKSACGPIWRVCASCPRKGNSSSHTWHKRNESALREHRLSPNPDWRPPNDDRCRGQAQKRPEWNYIIAPRVYGDRLKLSNVAVVLAFAVGAELGGVVGALIALPLAAAYPAIERIWLREKLGDDLVREHRAIERKSA